MELQGQVAIVTGAGRGIGRATALELARMGADIVVAELDPANAERTASEVLGLGRRALVVPTDVTSRKEQRAVFLGAPRRGAYSALPQKRPCCQVRRCRCRTAPAPRRGAIWKHGGYFWRPIGTAAPVRCPGPHK